MAIDELIEDEEKLEEIISSQRKIKLWNEFFNTLSENRLSFSCKKDSFNNVKSKRIGDALCVAYPFFIILPRRLEGIPETRIARSADNRMS